MYKTQDCQEDKGIYFRYYEEYVFLWIERETERELTLKSKHHSQR